ncbi:unnamed protein product [Timema podura]|uniref:STING ligand-binding domain-containing protein n=1 Tax=Timema podura TaxID=61482 RepID=A0ABN7NM80_TIMPD|nr:unnamed protein product [Timema podura]
MFEEFFHLRARYEGSVVQILKETFQCNTITYICSGCALFLMPWFWHVYGNFYKYIFKYESPLLCVLCTAFCFAHVIKMEESPLNRTLQLVQLGGLDYGSGMAYSFFYGYLQYILPNKGDSNKGTYFKSLDEENRNVAGVQARSYKNSIYKIRSPDNTELVYLAVEGATPVKTYYNVMRQDPQKGDSDKNGQPLDLSDILKTKLQEVKERHQPAVIESLRVNINVTETQPESVQLLESPTRHA